MLVIRNYTYTLYCSVDKKGFLYLRYSMAVKTHVFFGLYLCVLANFASVVNAEKMEGLINVFKTSRESKSLLSVSI